MRKEMRVGRMETEESSQCLNNNSLHSSQTHLSQSLHQHTLIQTHTHSLSLSYPHTNTHPLSLSLSLTHTHTQTHMHMQCKGEVRLMSNACLSATITGLALC